MSTLITEERIRTDLRKTLESEEPEVQAVAAEGIAKLMLTKILKDPEVQRVILNGSMGLKLDSNVVICPNTCSCLIFSVVNLDLAEIDYSIL
jgi:hypothetical protein